MGSTHCTTLICSWMIMLMTKGMELSVTETCKNGFESVAQILRTISRSQINEKSYDDIIKHKVISLHVHRDIDGILDLYYQQSLEMQLSMKKILLFDCLIDYLREFRDENKQLLCDMLLDFFKQQRSLNAGMIENTERSNSYRCICSWMKYEQLKIDIDKHAKKINDYTINDTLTLD